MSNFETFLDNLPDFAKDIKLNAKSLILSDLPDLTKSQVAIISIACGMNVKNKNLENMITEYFSGSMSESEMSGAKAAGTLMAMNNIYYRFATHLVTSQEYQPSVMPAGLRMSVMANPGISKGDFEIASLAVSCINGCGMCVDSHEKKLRAEGFSTASVQMAAKIASVINALSTLA